MMMTFDEAVEICKEFGDGLLLDGLLKIESYLDHQNTCWWHQNDGDDMHVELDDNERMAYYIVVREMRPLFA